MTPSENYDLAKVQTERGVSTLVLWVEEAHKSLTSDKLDGTTRARLGELLINACRYLAEREAAAKKAKQQAMNAADPIRIASKARTEAMLRKFAGL